MINAKAALANLNPKNPIHVRMIKKLMGTKLSALAVVFVSRIVRIVYESSNRNRL